MSSHRIYFRLFVGVFYSHIRGVLAVCNGKIGYMNIYIKCGFPGVGVGFIHISAISLNLIFALSDPQQVMM